KPTLGVGSQRRRLLGSTKCDVCQTSSDVDLHGRLVRRCVAELLGAGRRRCGRCGHARTLRIPTTKSRPADPPDRSIREGRTGGGECTGIKSTHRLAGYKSLDPRLRGDDDLLAPTLWRWLGV